MNQLTISKKLVRERIFVVRGIHVMIDRDLAELYEVSTKRLNEQVKRNMERFPDDFMFKLNDREKTELVAKCDHLKPLIYSSQKPSVFTEQGVAALSGVLKSKKAVEVSIQIMRAFIAMRRFISSNAQVFQRLDRVELKQIEHDEKFEQVFKTIEDKSVKPAKGIFYDGQVFDAYKYISDLVRSARESIVLVDNYVDDSVLTLFGKRNKSVRVRIFTKEISKQLKLDLEKYNSQYSQVEVLEFRKSHDRFMIIDDKEVYHFGASLKDLGKKWFAFTKFEKEALNILNKLK